MKKHDVFSKILHFGVPELINVMLTVSFQSFPAKFQFSNNDLEKRCKKLVWMKKKIFEKTGPKRFLWSIFWNFFLKKNRKIFKFFFLKVVISFLNMARKKSFFLKKISAQISTKIPDFIFEKTSCFFKKKNFLIFFSRYLYHKERF